MMLYLFLMFSYLGADVLIPTTTANMYEFKSYLFKHNMKSYTAWYLEHRTTIEDELLLIDIFNQAQEHYLNEERDLAYNNYLKIVNMEHDKDWKRPQRDLIVLSYQQILKISEHKNEIYKKRLLAYMNSYNIESPSKAISFSPKLEGWESVLVNGKHYAIKDLSQLKFYNIPYRWTLLSDKAGTHTLIATPNDFFNKFYPVRAFYLAKDCKNLEPKALNIEHKIFIDSDCVKAPIELADNKLTRSDTNNHPIIDLNLKPQRISKKKWYQSKWLWTSLALTAGYMIYDSQKKREDTDPPQPTHTEGF